MEMSNIPISSINLQLINNDDGSAFSIHSVSNKSVVTPYNNNNNRK